MEEWHGSFIFFLDLKAYVIHLRYSTQVTQNHPISQNLLAPIIVTTKNIPQGEILKF